MSHDDDQDVLGYGDQAVQNPANAVLKDHATEYGVLVAAAHPKRTTKTITFLMFAYPDYEDADHSFTLRVCVSRYYENKYGRKLKIIDTREWATVVEELNKYERVQTLIIATHGAPGQIAFDKNLSLGEIKSSFMNNKTGNVEAPTIETIHLEGCNIGDNPVALFEFGKFFHASVVTAYNMYHHTNFRWIEGGDVDGIEELLKPIKAYMIPGQPDAKAIAGMKRKFKIYYEWFSYSPEEDLPEKIDNSSTSLDDTYIKSRYHSRGSQVTKPLRTMQEAKSVLEEAPSSVGLSDELQPKQQLIRWEIYPQTDG